MSRSEIEVRVANCRRLAADLEARKALFGGARRIDVAAGATPFWSWLAAFVRRDDIVEICENGDIPGYPSPNGRAALWFSGGCESTYTLDALAGRPVDLLRIEQFTLFESEHRRLGQIHFLCAGISAALGYSTTFMGVERHDLLLTSASGHYVERSPEFLDAWSAYLPEHQMHSLCRHLSKEQILKEVLDRGLTITGTCDNLKDGRWCGDCFKCYEAFYTAKAINERLPIALQPAAFDRYYSEYEDYLRSTFTLNYNNAQQYFLRLQVLHGVRFDRAVDCSVPSGLAIGAAL